MQRTFLARDRTFGALLPGHKQVTIDEDTVNLTSVPKTWPVDSFAAHLRALMNRADIANYSELSRLTGVSESQFSNWRRGNSQPAKESLDRIAPTLGVAPSTLYVAAGLMTPAQLNVTDINLTVMPREILDLIEMYQSAESDDVRRMIREQVAFSLRGLRALIDEPAAPLRPISRRRAG